MTLLFGNIAFWIILFYFAAQSSRMGHEELVGSTCTLRISISLWLRQGLYHYNDCCLFFYRSYSGRVIVRPLGMQRHTRTYLYRRNRVRSTIPALLLLGLGNGFISIVGAGFLFGVGFGMFDANNMPILCQFVSAKYRATAYGIMNMTGVFAGAVVTSLFGKWTDGGNLGLGFAILGGIVGWAAVAEAFFVCTRIIWNDIISRTGSKVPVRGNDCIRTVSYSPNTFGVVSAC